MFSSSFTRCQIEGEDGNRQSNIDKRKYWNCNENNVDRIYIQSRQKSGRRSRMDLLLQLLQVKLVTGVDWKWRWIDWHWMWEYLVVSFLKLSWAFDSSNWAFKAYNFRSDFKLQHFITKLLKIPFSLPSAEPPLARQALKCIWRSCVDKSFSCFIFSTCAIRKSACLSERISNPFQFNLK